MTYLGKIFHPRRCGAGAVVCLLMIVFGVSAASARPGLFNFFDGPFYERARPYGHHVRRPHKIKRNDIRATPQKIPAGPVQVVISIARQRAILFSDGIRIAEGTISTGVPGHPTPMGVFSVISKSRYHRSNIYSGAPMPYMQRITWSGIAMHQGPLPGFPASHGCIRLTQAFAVKLWGISKVGTRVIVTRDEVAPVAIDNARLFVPKKPEEKPADGAAAPAMPTATAAIDEPATATDAVSPPAAAKPAAEPPKRKGLVEVFVSRKQAKVYVRQGFTELFEAPVTIAEPDQPWGTHVFTVMDIQDGKADWTVMTIPSGYAHRPHRRGHKLSAKEIERQSKRVADLADGPTAAQALARFELPKDTVERISELLAPGASLIVSDNALSDETGPDTGFIVATH